MPTSTADKRRVPYRYYLSWRETISVYLPSAPDAPTRNSGSLRPGSLDGSTAWRYYPLVIRSFRDDDTERVFRREHVRRFSDTLARVALRKLLMLDAAESLDDLRSPPGNRLERLSGSRAG